MHVLGVVGMQKPAVECGHAQCPRSTNVTTGCLHRGAAAPSSTAARCASLPCLCRQKACKSPPCTQPPLPLLHSRSGMADAHGMSGPARAQLKPCAAHATCCVRLAGPAIGGSRPRFLLLAAAVCCALQPKDLRTLRQCNVFHGRNQAHLLSRFTCSMTQQLSRQ